MTTDTEARPEAVVACYTERGPNFETALLLEPHTTTIDAARLARLELLNGFPNWELYRTVLAGDAIHVRKLKDFAIGLAVAHCVTGGVKSSVYSEELAGVAGLDALYLLMHKEPMQPESVSAKRIGVHLKTYTRLRDGLYHRLRRSMEVYFIILQATYRLVFLAERKCETRKTGEMLEVKGSRFVDHPAGNYRVEPAPDSDDL